MSTMLSFNGEILRSEDFSLSPENRAFRYGDGVFETIRVRQSRVLWAEHHFARLSHASEILQLIPDQEWTPARFQEMILQLYDANGHSGKDARIRLSMYRNEGGYYTPLTNKASILIESETLDQNLFEINTKGITIDVFPEPYKAFSSLSALKSINALIYVMAGIYKRNKGLGDVLLLNQEGRVAEATASNVFIIHNNKLITPSLSEACVDGIMRKVVIQIASDRGLTVREMPVTKELLLNADELLLTNAIQGIRWVRAFREKRFNNQMGTKLTDHLNEYARAYIRKNMAG